MPKFLCIPDHNSKTSNGNLFESVLKVWMWVFIPWPWQFRSMMCGDHDGPALVKFWTHLKTLPDYKHHQVLHNLTDEELSKTVPCSIHADGAEFHRNSEYFVTSWCSSFQTGGGPTCLFSRYPISLVSEAHIEDDDDFWICFQHLGQKTKKV